MWLLDNNTFKAIQRAELDGFSASTQQQLKFDALMDSSVLSTQSGDAQISIKGVITKEPSIFAAIFGGGNVTYSDISEAVRAANSDNSVSSITLLIDSPGGEFDGLFSALSAIKNSKKPITAVLTGVCASAAFAIASQADRIIAQDISNRIGSVGVVATYYVDEDEVTITSTDAPNKRPDVNTETGKDTVRVELDAMHEIFADAIADGRGVSVETVNKTFGQGSTFLAREALKRGMIDAIQSETLIKTQIGATMDIKTFKAQHSEIFEAAVEMGVSQERDRVSAHLMMGKSSGDMDTACTAVSDGSAMTALLQATYISAGMNRNDLAKRSEDDLAATGGDNVSTAKAVSSESDQVMAAIEKNLGIGV